MDIVSGVIDDRPNTMSKM